MKIAISVDINGTRREDTIEAMTPLVDFLRHQVRLTGAHVGCRSASCGACTVVLDGRTVKSCCVLAAEADGCSVQTVENGAESGLDDVQQAFVDCQAMQCGFCTPGMVVSTRALLEENPCPTRDEVRDGVRGNLCRCTGYTNIIAAVEEAARRRSAADPETAPTTR